MTEQERREKVEETCCNNCAGLACKKKGICREYLEEKSCDLYPVLDIGLEYRPLEIFAHKISKQKDLPNGINKAVDDNFWGLLI